MKPPTRVPRRESVRLLIAVAVALAIVIGAMAVSGGNDERAATAVPPDPRNGQSFIQDNLWSTASEQYAVWVAPDDTPFVGKRARPDGEWQVVSLADIEGNPLAAPIDDDEHRVLVVAVDSLGYVHVAGNMHGDPLRYIRSERPGDISGWTAAHLAGPASRVTYPSFVALPDGTLQFWRREGESGDGATVVDTLPPGGREWQTLGVVIDGYPSGENPYVHHVAVDQRAGTIHLVFEWRDTRDVATTNDVSYARSVDGGVTWEASDGRRLETPITHADAEVVVDTAPRDSGLINGGGLTVDREGRPHAIVVMAPGGHRQLVHLWHDGRRWLRFDVDGDTVGGRPAIAGLHDGSVWLLGAADGRLRAVEITDGRPAEPVVLGAVPDGWEATYDSQLLGREGRVETLVPNGAEPQVVVALD